MDYNLREKFFKKLDEEINSIIDKKTKKFSKKYLKKIAPFVKSLTSRSRYLRKMALIL